MAWEATGRKKGFWEREKGVAEGNGKSWAWSQHHPCRHDHSVCGWKEKTRHLEQNERPGHTPKSRTSIIQRGPAWQREHTPAYGTACVSTHTRKTFLTEANYSGYFQAPIFFLSCDLNCIAGSLVLSLIYHQALMESRDTLRVFLHGYWCWRKLNKPVHQCGFLKDQHFFLHWSK